jgi:hypothetical protein
LQKDANKSTNFCGNDPFFDARNLLHGLIDALRSQRCLHAEHGEVEQFIRKDGLELMRLLLQGHLDEHARQEAGFQDSEFVLQHRL